MQADIKIINAYILTVDKEERIIENGAIAIQGDSIIAIGTTEELEHIDGEETIDAQGNLLMPGLINAHTHAAMSIYRGMADDLPLQEWLNDHIFPAEAEFCTKESVITGTKLAILEMIRFGVTCFADMYYFEEDVAKVCNEMGIRALLSQAIVDFPAPDHKTSDEALKYIEQAMQEVNNHGTVTITPGPHSPYTCQADTLRKARKLANKYEVPLQIHLSETMFEYEESIKDHEKTPVKYCDDLGLFDGKTIAAHCVYINEEDREILKEKTVGVVNNPVSNMKLTSGVAPIPLLRDAGVLVGIGTDGVVSNNTLDIIEEMKIAALIHKVNNNNPTAMKAKNAVKLATIENAKILGMEDSIGSLEVGKKADMILIDINQPHLMPLYNIYSQLVYAVKGTDVDTVIINGKMVMINKKISGVDTLDIAIDAQMKANEVKAFIDQRIAANNA